VRFSRDIGNVTMDTAGVEQIDFEALAGSDLVTVTDLTGTDLFKLQLDLDGAAPGGGDGERDLLLRRGSTLGDTLGSVPGVSSSYFGPNAKAPFSVTVADPALSGAVNWTRRLCASCSPNPFCCQSWALPSVW